MDLAATTIPQPGTSNSASVMQPAVRGSSFSDMGAEALLNSMMMRPPGLMSQGPGIKELLYNQMPGHKMSVDFTSGRQPDH